MEYRSRFGVVCVWICFASVFMIICSQAFFFTASVWAWGRNVGMPQATYTYQEVLVRYRTEASSTDIGTTYTRLGLNEVSVSPYNGFRRVRVPINTSVYQVSSNLNQNPLVDFAEPNYIRTANFVPNDPLYQYQWHLNNPMMQQTWDQSVGSNVIVAVFDTGIAHRNGGGYALAPDLAETGFIPGYDFVNDDPYPDDDNRHGTHIAGVIAQSTNNLYGGSGVAPDCILMPVKVLDDTGAGSVADIVDAIYFAVNNGAQILNMSYGFVTSPSASEEEAVNYAVSQGVTIICSGGNEATNEAHYPSSYGATICVTATRYDLSFADTYSNFGPDVDVCGPGGDLKEDINNDGYPDGIYQQTHSGTDFKDFDFYFAEGTSCAAAFVSGVTALVIARAGRTLSPAEVRQILQTTATDLGDPGWDQFFGWGLVNPLAAVQAAVSYTTASTFGPRTGIPAINPINFPTYNYQSSVPSVGLSVNPISEGSIYQTNAGFVTAAQPVNQNIRTLTTPFSSGYASSGNIIQNNWSPIIPSSLGNLLSPFSPYQTLFLSQNLFAAPQQSVAYNGYNTNTSGGYQIESTIGSGYGAYPSLSWNMFLVLKMV